MANLKYEIDLKLSFLKNKVKEVQGLFQVLYNTQEKINNNKLIFIKRSVDNINKANYLLDNVTFEEKLDNSTNFAELKNLQKEVLAKIGAMEEILDKNKSSNMIKVAQESKKNMDYIRMAAKFLKGVDVDSGIDAKTWQAIETKGKSHE